MKWLEQFILGIPTMLLKKIPYAWLGAVCFWSWPPVFSGILLAIVLLGLLMMVWQQRAWEARIRREFSSGKTKPLYRPPARPTDVPDPQPRARAGRQRSAGLAAGRPVRS